MIESEHDRLEILKALGEQVTINGVEVWVTFDKSYIEELAGPGAASSEPELIGRTSDLDSFVQSDVVERDNGEKYRIRKPEPDGTGMSLVRLRNYG